MESDSRIFVAGHEGLVGSAIARKLKSLGFKNIILKNRAELDLRDQHKVQEFFAKEKLDYVFIAAAKVGGILANNTYPAEFIYDNIMIQSNLIHQSYVYKAKKLLFLGSSCIYPKFAEQPIKEEYLLTGLLEPTNEPYAIAKIAGIKMCKSYNGQYGTNFISTMPTNLYGPNDNFDLHSSHVLPALIRKMHEAKTNGKPDVEIWGTGKPLRELLHVDDLADACVYLMKNCNYSDIGDFVNIGTGKDISIKQLAEMVKRIVGFPGTLRFDNSKPDGTPKKLLDVSKLASLGWTAKIGLEEGIRQTHHWFVSNHSISSN